MKKLLVGLLTLGCACGDDPVEMNHPPEVVVEIPPREMATGDTVMVDLTLIFRDPDGDTLSFSSSSSGAVVTAASGSILHVAADHPGVDTVVVTASDPDGESAKASAQVTVLNSAPVVTQEIPDHTLFRGDTILVDLTMVFEDPDDDDLEFETVSSDTAVVTDLLDTNLFVGGAWKGMATVTVTATDPSDASVETDFDVMVPNRGPVVRQTIPTQEIGIEETKMLWLNDYFTDPDLDKLSYEVLATNEDAMSVTRSNDTLFLEGLEVGRGTVTVTAMDDEDEEVAQTFEVSVSEDGGVVSWEDQFNSDELSDDWTTGGGGDGGVTSEDSSWIRVHLFSGDWKARAQPLVFEDKWTIVTSVKIESEDEGWACASVESRIDDDNFLKWAMNLDADLDLIEINVRDDGGDWLFLAEYDYEFEHDEYYEVGWWIEGDSMHVSVDGETELSFDPRDGDDWPDDDIQMPTRFNGVSLGMVTCGTGSPLHAGYDWVKIRGR